MPPKKAAPKPLVPSRESFFLPHRPMVARKDKTAQPPPPPEAVRRELPRRFLYEQGTGVAYAEVVRDVAVCVNSGCELFKFRNARQVYRVMFRATHHPLNICA